MQAQSTQTKITKAVIYCRVSSQKQVTEGHGLESQRARAEEFAKLRGLDVVEIFKDDMTGSVAGRPGMKAMIDFLKAKREPHIVIIDDITRLARSMSTHLMLREKIKNAGGILQSPSLEFGDDSDSQLVEHLLASVSQHQRQKISETTKNRMRGRMLNGYWTFRAPIGYKFKRHEEHGNLLVRDEPVASLIQEIFEGYAAGRFQGAAEIMRYLEAHPDWPQSRREHMTVERVLELLERVHYAGYLDYPEWGIHMKRGKHDPIVSLTVFNQVQERIKGKANAPARKDLNLDFVLRGAVTCHDCGQPYRACWTKGRHDRYPYYLCQTKGCASYGKSIKRDVIEGEFESLLRSLKPTPSLFETAQDLLRELWDARVAASHSNRVHLIEEVKRIEQQIEQLVDRIVSASSQTIIAAYENRLSSLEARKAEVAEMIENCGRPLVDFDTTHRTALGFLENPYLTWAYGSFEHKRAVLRLAFPAQLSYQRNHGFRTAETAIPFRIFNDLEDFESEDSEMVPRRGLEPPRRFQRRHLKTVRLPIPPSGHGAKRLVAFRR